MNQSLLRPIPDSYWVVPSSFLAGEYPAHPQITNAVLRLNAFLQMGFTTFINLTRDGELPPYDVVLMEQAAEYGLQVNHLRFPIRDFGLPTADEMKNILDAIDAALAKGEKIYLHCWGGVGRTGTTVGCYLVRHGRTGEDALNQLAQWWREVPKSAFYPASPETDEQREFVLQWKE
jgi:protein-tyrosine phosphatase